MDRKYIASISYISETGDHSERLPIFGDVYGTSMRRIGWESKVLQRH